MASRQETEVDAYAAMFLAAALAGTLSATVTIPGMTSAPGPALIAPAGNAADYRVSRTPQSESGPENKVSGWTVQAPATK
jgi:hypothetical protein